ncbi:MAG: hypothetical protein RLZZ522_1734 [Verrucomicrobiota bacterium]
MGTIDDGGRHSVDCGSLLPLLATQLAASRFGPGENGESPTGQQAGRLTAAAGCRSPRSAPPVVNGAPALAKKASTARAESATFRPCLTAKI